MEIPWWMENKRRDLEATRRPGFNSRYVSRLLLVAARLRFLDAMLSVRALSKSRALSLRAVHNNVRQSLSPAHYTSRIVSAAHNNRFSEALDIAASMKRDGVQPDKRTYDSLLSCAAAHNSWLFAWAIFDDMIACGIQPTASSFLPLLQVYRSLVSHCIRQLTLPRPKPSVPF